MPSATVRPVNQADKSIAAYWVMGQPSPQGIEYNAHNNGKKGGGKRAVSCHGDSVMENCPEEAGSS